jgi:hypothetical protein
MSFPVYLPAGSLRVHPHWVFETLAYAVGFCVYRWLRRRNGDVLDDASRWWLGPLRMQGAGALSTISPARVEA